MSTPDPRCWYDAFLSFKDDAAALAGGLSPAAFNRPPAPEQWSVGQCLDHLNATGRPLVARLERALAAAPAASGRAPRLGLLDRLFCWSMEPGGWLKMPSPGAYRPASGGSLDREHTVRAFQAIQDDLAACAQQAEGRDWSAVRAASPASRFLRLSAGGWLAGTLAHQRRHFAQAHAVRRQRA